MEKTLNFLSDVLHASHVEPCQLLYEEIRGGVTRFADDRIHQSAEIAVRSVTVQVSVDGKRGLFRTTRFDQDALSHAAQQAYVLAEAQGAPAHASSLAPPTCGTYLAGYDEATARAQPFERAQIIRNLLDARGARKATLSGAISTTRETFATVSTEGTRVFEERTRAEINLVARSSRWTGRAYWVGFKLREAPLRRLLEETLVTAVPASDGWAEVELGTTSVVLDSLAAGQMIGYLAYLGFGAKAYLERRSFLCDKLGQCIAPEFFTMIEDPVALVPRGYDYDGVARQRVVLVDRGVARGLVTDWQTAAMVESSNTGHAPHPDSLEGPLPGNVVVAPGEATLDELVQQVEDGVYVRDLHYVNVVEPVTATITGMTRHGTFRIRNGRLAEPLPELRFQVSILDVLGSLIALGKELRPAEGVGNLVEVPPMAARRFAFTGVAEGLGH